MAAPNSAVASVDSAEIIPAFAKLQGEHFVYYMRTYSIILGRSTETYGVDFDICELGGEGDQYVSRHHACIFYNFEKRHFALELLGRNGCKIQNVSYAPGSDPVELRSQDLIEIAGKQFYFLLPRTSSVDNYGHSNGGNLVNSGELDISANSSGFNANPAGING